MSPEQWAKIARNANAFPNETVLAIMDEAVSRALVHERAGDRIERIKAMSRYAGFGQEAAKRGLRVPDLARSSDLLEGVFA